MTKTKKILSIFLEKEPAAGLLFKILSTNISYTDKLQKFAENFAKQTGVTSDE